jgi:uncharacterized protein YjbJ (UPF0337 family)
MSLRDKLELGLKPDAPYRPDNLPEHQQDEPACHEGAIPGDSPQVESAREACDEDAPSETTSEAGRRRAAMSPDREDHMNRDQIEGKWKELKGEAKIQWGKLTDDDLTQIDGTKDKLVGVIQQRYGYAREQAAKEVEAFWDRQTTKPGV